ncbi:MAG: heat-inducible transcription repressor HrcA [Calditrichaeota bacterium]|nr:heat-inducible transcription repressor HrcA [Calditrichota bacterium]
MERVPLTEREKLILSAIVQYFIKNAAPVSSSYIAQKEHLSLSPATIRNIMASLEEKGYISQPHTSAGRVPTTIGYRMYVDTLMKRARLSQEEKEAIRKSLRQSAFELEEIMREATNILAQLSRQLGIVVSPKLEEGIFHRMEIVRLSTERVLLVLSIQSGMVKTITLEIPTRTSAERLQSVARMLNERLFGMRLIDIRKRFHEIIRDIRNEETGILKQLNQIADRLFDFEEDKEIFFKGTHNIVQQPEFSDVEKFSSVIELLEDQEVIIHLLDVESQNTPISIKIGEEIQEKRMQTCSIISARYRIHNISGTIGIIGPTRMNYSKLVSLVDFTARTITETLENAYN